MSTEAASTAPKEQAFFAEEASKQILIRIAGVLQDPDLCDASFIVEDGADKEEIRAPSQIMAMSSPYFKSLFYPSIIGDSKEKEINGMQPKTFRKILDYLFRGRVPLSSIEDAWKVKVAGRMFQLKELEELCTKFLQYRIDSRNLIHFLKNTIKYDTPDLRDVVIARLLKDADKAFDNEQMLDLSEEELYNIMAKRPQVQGRKAMDVLIRWAKKRFALEAPKVEKKEEPEEKKVEEVKDVEMKEEKKDDEKKEEEKKEDDKKEDEKTEESKKDEEKKEESKMDVDAKPEEEKKDETKKEGEEVKKDETKSEEKKDDVKKEEEKKEDDIVEIIDEEKKVTEEPQEYDYVERLGRFVKFITWDHTDAPYYLKEVRGKKVLSTEDQNEAMTKMLESFVANDGKSPVQQQAGKMQQEQIRPQSPAMRQMGPKSTQQQQRGRPVQKR